MSQAEAEHWSILSLLDVLRPPPGWEVTDAILSTYSLDLVVLASCLLALTGHDKQDGRGSKTGLAHAIGHFRPDGGRRLAALVQSGCIYQPRRTPKVLALLDRFVREIKRDQRHSSWHAKAALVRLQTGSSNASDVPAEWRLWLGSRNLTRDVSWDTGLVLTGASNGDGGPVKGLSRLTEALLAETGWPPEVQRRLISELSTIRWSMPDDATVTAIDWLDGAHPWQPSLPSAVEEIAVITPFFDHYALKALENAVDETTPKALLTTQDELDQQLAKKPQRMREWTVSCLVSSAQGEKPIEEAPEEGSIEASPEPWSDDDEELPMGLHAKIIAARTNHRVRLLMGSANVTQRAWKRNAELIVTIEGDPKLWDGVTALMSLADHAEPMEQTIEPAKSANDWLAEIRNSLSTLQLAQVTMGNRVTISADKTPEAALSETERNKWEELGLRFGVGPLGAFGDELINWPLTQAQREIVIKPGSLAGESEFLCFQLSTHEQQVRWVQYVPLDPHPGLDRDRRILAEYLTPGQFLSWLGSLLLGYEGDEEDWFEQTPRRSSGWGTSKPIRSDAPTVEAILKAWQRDHRSLQEVAESLTCFLDLKALKIRHRGETDRQWIRSLEDLDGMLQQMNQAFGKTQ